MKKFLCSLLFAAPTFLLGQGMPFVTNKTDYVVLKDGAVSGGGGSSAFDAITSGTNTTATMTCGTGCTITTSGSGVNSATAVPVGGITGLGSGVATWLATASSANLASALTDETGTGLAVFASNPAFTLFTVGNGATGPGSFDVLEDSDNGTNYIRTIGQSSLSANRTYTLPDISADGTYVVSPALYPGMHFNPTKETVLFDDFYSRAAAGGATVGPYGQCWVVGVGTGSGALYPAAATLSAPLNTKQASVQGISTGTTTTGAGILSCGGSASGAAETISIHGGEIVEWRAYVETASGATNTHRTYFGFCDNFTTNGDCTDGMYIYWNNNSDTHWGCETISNSVSTSTVVLSNTVATAQAWHDLRVEVNSNATSVAFKVDGAELSCSPLTSNIPTGIARGTQPMMKIAATAGCASATTCSAMADYVYFYQPGLAR